MDHGNEKWVVTAAEAEEIKLLVIRAETMPFLQMAWFVAAINERFGIEASDRIVRAAAKGRKVEIKVI